MRLKRKLKEVLEAYLGKDHVDFEDADRSLMVLVKLADRSRLISVYFPPRRPVLFVVDFGYFTENVAECISALYDASQMSMRIGQQGRHMILTFEQILTEETTEALTPELVQLLEDDLGEMDAMIAESSLMASRISEEDEDDPEESGTTTARPPDVVLH